ncbi:hypothetical protein [Chondrinema litorale]|uniref:hypothetical protein n=1 Tax=Chondrinema litorale TaxID=2994555 RepID=UPI0025429BC2|nr:hypothetical protein [Chondrinema litorale]UZR99719.1 hypothetical protein OQ292_38155 [Chondrinema litorale]
MDTLIMKYLPLEDITYQTKLNTNEIVDRLNEVVEPKKTFRMNGFFGNSEHKPYEGSIHNMSFKINRIIGYRNSFIPIITGTLEEEMNGTKVNVKMRLHSFVIVFMFIWFGGVGIASLAVISYYLNNENFEPMSLIPFGMLIFGYAMVLGGFKYESIKSKKYLAELFEAKII